MNRAENSAWVPYLFLFPPYLVYTSLSLFGISGSLASGKARLTPGLVVARNVLALYIPVVVQVI